MDLNSNLQLSNPLLLHWTQLVLGPLPLRTFRVGPPLNAENRDYSTKYKFCLNPLCLGASTQSAAHLAPSVFYNIEGRSFLSATNANKKMTQQLNTKSTKVSLGYLATSRHYTINGIIPPTKHLNFILFPISIFKPLYQAPHKSSFFRNTPKFNNQHRWRLWYELKWDEHRILQNTLIDIESRAIMLAP